MMQNYKDPQDKVHYLDDDTNMHMLPDGCVPITVEEVEAIRLTTVVPSTPQQLREADYPPLGDVIDALCKYIETGDKTEFDIIQGSRNAVKERYPKV